MFAPQLIGSTALTVSARIRLRFPGLGQLMIRLLESTAYFNYRPAAYPPSPLFRGLDFDDSRIQIVAPDRQEMETVLAPLAQVIDVTEVYPFIRTREELRRFFRRELNRILFGPGIFEIFHVHGEMAITESCASFVAQACIGDEFIHPRLAKLAQLLQMHNSREDRLRIQSSAWWQNLVLTHRRAVERNWDKHWSREPAPIAWATTRFEVRFRKDGGLQLLLYPVGADANPNIYSAGQIILWADAPEVAKFWMTVASKRLQYLVQTPHSDWPWMIGGSADEITAFLAHWRRKLAPAAVAA